MKSKVFGFQGFKSKKNILTNIGIYVNFVKTVLHMKSQKLLLTMFLFLASCHSGEPEQSSNTTPLPSTRVEKPKKLWVIYEVHDQRQLSLDHSVNLIKENQGEYVVYLEGSQDDTSFFSGQKFVVDGSTAILIKEDSKYRYADSAWLNYMFDTVSKKSMQMDKSAIVDWITKYYPNQRVAMDTPFWKLSQLRNMKDSFNRNYKNTEILTRLRAAELNNIAFENSAIAELSNYTNAHIIMGVAHMRIAHVLCDQKEYSLQKVNFTMDANFFYYSLNLPLVQYLVVPDSLYKSTAIIYPLPKFKR